jgi:hypothetical protein
VAPLATGRDNPGFSNQTLSLIVHTSIGGNEVRVRISNVFGTRALVVGQAHIALRSAGADTQPGTDRVLTFNGARSITIPPGQLAASDAVALRLRAFSDVAVSLYFPEPTGPATYHPLALSTNYVAAGDVVGAVQFPAGETENHWPYLTDVEVGTPAHEPAIVAFGDSITDGFRSTPGAIDRSNRR